MEWRELGVSGAWEITPRQYSDPRGVFLELYKRTELTSRLGRTFEVAQTNTSVSAAGAVRGIHFSDTPPGQAKYVTCVTGAVLDVVVDTRVGSATFGQWDCVVLDDLDRRATFVPEGVGHAFCALEDGSAVVYLCSTGYAPSIEHGIHPFDPDLAIKWPTATRSGSPLELVLSDKDAAAPSLAEAMATGILPDVGAVTKYLAAQRQAHEEPR